MILMDGFKSLTVLYINIVSASTIDDMFSS